MGFRYPHHQRTIRVAPDPPGIPGAALTRPDDDHRDRCHISDLPRQAATVLASSKGFTLYSSAPDTPASSTGYGSCAAYWPPVTGTAAGQGLPAKVATITRTGGARQLTYNGHPLYTYIGDTAPGQAHGNNLNLNGGLWHEVPASR